MYPWVAQNLNPIVNLCMVHCSSLEPAGAWRSGETRAAVEFLWDSKGEWFGPCIDEKKYDTYI